MARNGSGSYSLPSGNPVVTGSTISSTEFNNTLTDIATALTGSVAADGQTALTGNLPMGGNRLTGLGNATATTDGASFGQVGTVLLSAKTASNSASIDFTGLSGSGYGGFLLLVDSLGPATNATIFNMRLSTGSGFISLADYRYGVMRWDTLSSSVSGTVNGTEFALSGLTETCSNSANFYSAYSVSIIGPDHTANTKQLVWSTSGVWSSGNYAFMQGGGHLFADAAPIDGISLYMSSGNIVSGHFRLYGLRNS